MKRIFTYMVFALLLSSNLKAESIDGIFFSVGAGFSHTTTDFKETYSGWETGELGGEDGLAMSLKAGIGINKDLAIYLFRNSSFVPGYENDPNDSVFGNCVMGLGFNYYLDQSNVFYLIGGVGEGEFAKISDAFTESYLGKGYLLGFGVNLIPNWHLEVTYFTTDIDDKVGDNTMNLESESTQFLLSYYWY